MRPARDEKEWIFVSDAHFTGRQPGEMESFLSLLDREREGMGHLVILGDLFEFLFGFKPRTPPRPSPFDGGSFPYPDYLPVFRQLLSLYQQGVQIKYFEGNHDFSLKSFFAEYFGMNVEVYSEGHEDRLGSKRAYIAHGDLSNPHQWKYRLFRRCLKNRVTEQILRGVGPAFTRRIARRLNGLSHQHYHQNKPAKPSSAFQSFAHQKFLEGFDLVVLGHSHIPETAEEQIHGKHCLYYNVGDWMNHRSYLRFVPPDRFTLERYDKPSNPPQPPFSKGGGQGGIINCMRDPEKDKDGEIGCSGDGEQPIESDTVSYAMRYLSSEAVFSRRMDALCAMRFSGQRARKELAMAISKELLDILACPKCKGEIFLNKAGDGLICKSCRLLYQIKDDIPVMLIDEALPYGGEA